MWVWPPVSLCQNTRRQSEKPLIMFLGKTVTARSEILGKGVDTHLVKHNRYILVLKGKAFLRASYLYAMKSNFNCVRAVGCIV